MKIQPVNYSISTKEDALLLESDQKAKISPIKTTSCGGIISVRTFIIILITSLLVFCSTLIWLASFIGSREAMSSLSTQLMINIGDSVLNYMDGELKPFIGATESIAEDYNLGIVSKTPPLPYLYKMITKFKPYGIGLFFNNSVESLNYFGTPPNESVIWYHKPVDKETLFTVGLDTSTPNTTAKNIIAQSDNYSTDSQSYWTTTFSYYTKLGLDGVFGIPYAIPGNPSYTTYFCVKLFDPSLYIKGVKRVVGIAKTNISLRLVQNFLKTVKVLTHGYVVVAERNNLVIGGNINTTALDGSSRVSIFDLIDKNSGNLLKKAYTKYNGWEHAPSFFELEDCYILNSNYSLVNLKWNVFIVVEKQEVEMVTNITTGVSVGITILIIILGIVMSVTIGHVVTNPFNTLEREFMKIKTMELEQVNITASKFSEVDTIYLYLYEMTVWLNEIKSFIPESVFLQLRSIKQENGSKAATDPKGSNEGHQVNTSSVLSSGLESDSSSKHVGSKNSSMVSKIQESGTSLFKIGLHHKQCSVIRVKLVKFSSDLNYSDIGNVFAKIVSGLSAITKSVQGDFQVLSVDDYQIYVSSQEGSVKKSCNMLALGAALKLNKLITTINETSKTHIRCVIGVSGGKCYSGNLGTSIYRTFTVVGSVPINAENLSILANNLNCNVLADEGVLDPNTIHNFVVRPVDKLLTFHSDHSEGKSSTVYEVHKENLIEGDEWMYELEQQKENQKFSEFSKLFFYNVDFEGMNKQQVLEYLKNVEASLQNTPDSVPKKLLKNLHYYSKILESSEEMDRSSDLLKHYHSVVGHHVSEVYLQ